MSQIRFEAKNLIDLVKLTSTPIVWILIFLACGLILMMNAQRRRWAKKAGSCLAALGILLLYFFSIEPVSNLLVYSLESRYSPPSKEALSNLDIVVVLGGGVMQSGGFRKGPEASGSTYSRLFNGVEIFRQSGAKTLVLSGTSPQAFGESEAEVMKGLAMKLGVPPEMIVTETKSRNTMEHVSELVKLFPPSEKRRIGIVTSAVHMFRAERAFVKKFSHSSIVPIPVGCVSSPPDLKPSFRGFIPNADNFSMSSYAIHELIGMVWYFLRNAV